MEIDGTVKLRVNDGTPNGADCNRTHDVPRVAIDLRLELKNALDGDNKARTDGLHTEISNLIIARGVSADLFTVCVLDDVINDLLNTQAAAQRDAIKTELEAKEKENAQLRAMIAKLQAKNRKKVDDSDDEEEEEEKEEEDAEPTPKKNPKPAPKGRGKK